MRLSLILASSFLLASCSDDAGESGDSGTASDTDSADASDGSASAGDGSCVPAAAVRELAVLPPESEGLALGDDALYTIDRAAGGDTALGKSGVVMRVPKDGSAATAFYTPEAPRRVQAIWADGADVFIAELDPADPNGAPGRVVKKRGEVVTELIATGISKALVNLFASDAEYLYLDQEAATSGSYGIYRLAKNGGALEPVVEVESGAFLSTQMVGDAFVFTAQVDQLYRVGKDNAGAPATAVGQKTCTTGYAATSDAIYCGQALEVERTGPNFEPGEVLFRVEDVAVLDAAGATGPQPRLATDDSVYVHFSVNGQPVPLVAIDRATSSIVPTLCEVGWVGNILADASSVYVLQVRDEAFAPAAKLYATAR